jgi:sulfite reductase beta subunit-like hemoprotein
MATTKSKARFEAVETKDGEWYVRLMLPGGRQPQIDGFKTKAEAQRWIKAQSAAWLKMYEGGKYA